MSLDDPLINFRARVDIRDLIQLHCKQINKPLGTVCRQYILERIALERFLELLRTVDVPEVLRRLSVPSGVMTMMQGTSALGQLAEQTSDNLVRQPREVVLQGSGHPGPVLQRKPSKTR